MSTTDPSERVERLAQQLLAEGYVSTEEEARLAAEDVLAAAAAMPTPADGGAARSPSAQEPEPEEFSPA
jgi:hypothetical protein